MALKKTSFKTISELIEHIKSKVPTYYFSSQTSTVIPYDKLEEIYKDEDFLMGDLSRLPSKMELDENNNLIIEGPINWKEAKSFLRSKGRNIMTSPTEELALITAGAATSATGERCFHFGNLRSQIIKIKYLNHEGIEKTLSSSSKLNFESSNLNEYKKDYQKYQEFKNAPFPRLETETDLLIGTEGQLGVITCIELKTTDDFSVNHLFMLLPKWEENDSAHLELLNKIQNFRDNVILCEFIDSNSFSYLPKKDRPNQELDAIFFEIKSDFFESFYENFLLDLSFLNEEQVFELSESKFHNIRASIPRAVFEENSKMGVTKMGTDVQVKITDFKELLKIYRNFSKQGIRYNLFGHFGDAHLHFNFMPQSSQMPKCQEQLEQMYKSVFELGGSPFAEHGIGIIKQKYIKGFWNKNSYSIFLELKNKFDPNNQFFPQGFLNLKEDK